MVLLVCLYSAVICSCVQILSDCQIVYNLICSWCISTGIYYVTIEVFLNLFLVKISVGGLEIVRSLELVRSAVIFHIGFSSKDCAKRKNLSTTVFTPMELEQTLVTIFFFFHAHIFDLAHTSLQEASIGEP